MSYLYKIFKKLLFFQHIVNIQRILYINLILRFSHFFHIIFIFSIFACYIKIRILRDIEKSKILSLVVHCFHFWASFTAVSQAISFKTLRLSSEYLISVLISDNFNAITQYFSVNRSLNKNWR